MRYALISDIHGNLEAFRAVLEALSKEKIDEFLFIGDVVGYGADPKECLKLLRSIRPKILISGNHEWGVLGLLDESYFNDYVAKAVAWTKSVLDGDELDYLRSFDVVHEDGSFALVHGSLYNPAGFNYIWDSKQASAVMKIMKAPICFAAHTHVAGIFYTDKGRMEFVSNSKKAVRGEKYIVNAGSIGQPRDGDPRASFVIYDTESAVFEIRRVPYDIKSAQVKILKAGLPTMLADRLAEGR
ncbi:MAG: metallophosphoesterase family protein [Candidatus Omnitrophota bacterium]